MVGKERMALERLIDFIRENLGGFVIASLVVWPIIVLIVVCLTNRVVCAELLEQVMDHLFLEAIKERLRELEEMERRYRPRPPWPWLPEPERPEPIEPLVRSPCFAGPSPSWVQRLRESWGRRGR